MKGIIRPMIEIRSSSLCFEDLERLEAAVAPGEEFSTMPFQRGNDPITYGKSADKYKVYDFRWLSIPGATKLYHDLKRIVEPWWPGMKRGFCKMCLRGVYDDRAYKMQAEHQRNRNGKIQTFKNYPY
ncbi:hypothetical protein Tco_0868610 [Tanacetum coccineum]